MDMDFRLDGDNHLNPTFLYSGQDDLLGPALLTPDSEPTKFNLPTQKVDTFDYNIGIYDPYDDSRPPSVQFGDGLDPSEHEGSHVSTNGNGIAPASVSNDIPEGTDGGHYATTNGDFHPVPSAKISKGSKGSKKIHGQALEGTTSSARTSSKNTPNKHGSGQRAKRKSNGLDDSDESKTHRRISSDTPKKASDDFRARTSIPMHLSWMEFARQGIVAAYSSRLNPYALHPGEYKLLREHITRSQVTIYLNIRNAILRLWHRNPLAGITRQEAAGCVKDPRYFPLSQITYEWLMRNGYINFGCVELTNTARPIPRSLAKGGRRKTIVVVGAGMSGLGCARQLEGLIAQLGEQFTDKGERTPKIIILEGRNRVGGRVYSHPLKKQANGILPPGLRSTAEMGAQIVTGFEHGNPMNAIIRGQLGLRYYALKDNSVLYDYDGRTVDKRRDVMVERLWNDVLERAAVYRNKLPTMRTVEGERELIRRGEDPKDSISNTAELISSLEDAGVEVTVRDGNPISTNTSAPENPAVGLDKVGGRQYQLAGSAANKPAAEAAKIIGWNVPQDIPLTESLDLLSITQASPHPTLGETMDEGIKQYQEMLGLTSQDLRLMNWHHANLEYANAANVNQLSLGGWDQDIGNEFEGEHCEVVGGYTQVPRGLWQYPQQLDVRFNHAIKTIKYGGSSLDPPALVECHNGEKFEADEVVLTSSLGVLKEGSIKFVPPLPDWKTSCIERMGFGLLNKVVLVYDKAFWEEDRDMFGLLNDAEHDKQNQRSYADCRGRFYLFWNCIQTSGRPMLIALMAGTAAYSVEETDNESLVAEVTGRLAKVFPLTEIPRPSEVIVTRWKKDPFARGSYSYVGPQTQTGDYDIMAQPVGPIHFAGEATCGTHPATVHGAYLSGLRAASEVLDSLLGPIQVSTPIVTTGGHKVKVEQAVRSGSSPLTDIEAFETNNAIPGDAVSGTMVADSSVPSTSVAGTTVAGSSGASVAGIKRKRGYVDVWEPVLPPPDPNADTRLQAEAEDYEARIIGAILSTLSDRPIKPGKPIVNPYLLYQNDEWYNVKARCDSEKVATTGDPNAKTSRNDIRIALGADWRNLREDLKKPYVDKSQEARESSFTALANYKEAVETWDREAERVRNEFIAANPPSDGVMKRLEGRTAIEFGQDRKGRKTSGYAE
ncbi:hypothetical protein EG328_000693 [Venturia inaequalis]|uniref:SWIRM domain-containing protein n=1 Tax=Venturia inaequalis TaxID=5025 RepID=A0A8H3V1M0_VENIN|nr:hypothetical protein EG328_000693 [Venturia inaequalis]